MFKLKYLSAVGLLTLSSFYSFGQEDDDENPKDDNIVYIEKLAEAPQDLSMFVLQIPIWHLAGSKINTSILDLKGKVAYVGAGKMNGGISYKFGLGDKIAPETFEFTDNLTKSLVMSVNKVPKAQELDAYGIYYINEKVKDVEESIRLKQVGKTVYVTSVKTKQLVKTGLSLGYTQGFTWYNMNNLNLSLTSLDDPTFTREVSMNSMSTVQDFKFIKLGVSQTKSVNLKINAKGYGERSASWLSVNNFNLIVAVQNSFDDVYVGTENTSNNTVELTKYSISDENAKLPIGFEYSSQHFYKGSAIAFEYGVKYLPGLMKNINLMVNFGLSVSIDFLRKNNFK